MVRFNNEPCYRAAVFYNRYSDSMLIASPYLGTTELARRVLDSISVLVGSDRDNTVARNIALKAFKPDIRSIMKRVSKVEAVSAATYAGWCFDAQDRARVTLTAAKESYAIKKAISTRYDREALSDDARVAAFHAMDNLLRGTPMPPSDFGPLIVAEFTEAFKKVDAAREDDAAALGKTLVQVIKFKFDKEFLVKCGDTVRRMEQLPDNVAVAAATLMTVGDETVYGIGAQGETNLALDMNMVLLIEGAL
jgi:hypothetical protein